MMARSLGARSRRRFRSGDGWRAVRRLGPAVAFIAIALAAAATLLVLASDLTFHSDEWTLIAHPPGPGLSPWFEPHNEHWVTVLYVAYYSIFRVVGLSSYMPYLAVLIALHLVAAAGLYRLVSTLSGPWVSVGCATLLLFLGAAYQDLFWAFQIGFVGSTAAGIWSLVAIANRRFGLAALLSTLSVASSGIGLPFLAASLVEAAASSAGGRRRWWLALAVLVYGVWFALFGRAAVSVNNDVFSAQSVLAAAPLVPAGVANAISKTSGLEGVVLGLAIGAGLVIVGPALVRRRGHAEPGAAGTDQRLGLVIALAAAVGIVSLFVLVGLTRSQLGPTSASQSRYVYPAAAFVLIGVAGVVNAARQRLARSRRVALAALGTVVLVAGLVGNLRALVDGHAVFVGNAHNVNATVALVERYGNAPAVDPDRDLFPLPPPARLMALIRTKGWPRPPADLRDVPPDVLDRALFQLVGPLPPISAAIGSYRPANGIQVVRSSAEAGVVGSQVSVRGGPDASIELGVRDGATLLVTGPPGGHVETSIGRFADPPPESAVAASMPASGSAIVRVPRLDDGGLWKLSVIPATAGAWTFGLVDPVR
jgi:hypothetical protein